MVGKITLQHTIKEITLLQSLFGPQNFMLIARILAMLVAIPVHEVAHGWVSDKLGDHTARQMGRITLNPIKHLDMFGLLSMLIIGVGWAKPVPVNPHVYKNRKLGMAITALAGPTSNFILAFISVIAFKSVFYIAAFSVGHTMLEAWPLAAQGAYYVLMYFALINITLALFNLIPIPPLDGSRILGVVLPERIYFGIMRYERYILFALLGLIVIVPMISDFSPIGWLLGDASDTVLQGLLWLTGFVDVLFTQLAGVIF